MAERKSGISSYAIHSIIGLAIIAIFWIIPPIAPITEVGMRCVGTFIGVVYLWSMVDVLWPSVLCLFLFAISGYGGAGAAGFKAVFLNAIGADTVLISILGMILFGAMHEVGCTMYIARWFLTKSIFKGRPYTFLTVWFLCCGVLSALVGPIVGLIIVWSIALGVMNTLEIKREDKIWPFFFVGTFLALTLMQPFFPFKGAQLVPISAFENMMATAGTAVKVPYLPYMITATVMFSLIMGVYLVAMKFILRVDMGKMKGIDPEMIRVQIKLPPMNFQQKAFLFMMVGYLAMILIPGFVKGNPICDFLNMVSTLGVTVFWIVLFTAIRWNGKPLLEFQKVAATQMNWGIFFMIAAAVYGAGSLSNKSTGVSDFLVQTLNPILGGQPEIVFVALMLLVALIITNFANNAAMAVVLMPVVIGFSNQIGIHPMPVAMGVTLMVFVAMLTPSASPHASMMHGKKDIYTTKEILMIGLPMCAICWILYVVVGYPLMKMMLGV